MSFWRAFALLLVSTAIVTCLAGKDARAATDGEEPSDAAAAADHADDEAHDEHGDDHADDEAHDAAGHGEHADGDHHGGEHAESEPNPLVVDPDLAIFTGIVFLILFWILAKFAWPSISLALEERERKIADHIASAEAKHDEAKRLLASHEAKLAATADEVRALLDEARRDAEVTKDQIVTEARDAADQERQRAVRDVEQAKDAALHDLANASAGLAVDLASKVVAEQVSSERQNALVKEAVEKLSASKPNLN